MSDGPEGGDAKAEQPKKKSKIMLFGLVGAVLLGGGSFYGVYSGLIPLPFGAGEAMGIATHSEVGAGAVSARRYDPQATDLPAFVALEEFVVSLGPQANSRHLRLALDIEVAPGAEADVEALKPRIRDVLNTYMRAVDEREFEIPLAMLRLRSQMLRRVQLVTPPGAVRDLLIQEFVLN